MTTHEPPRRQVIRAAPRRPSDRSHSPVTDDLYQPDAYGRELLTSLMRAQAGVSLAVLVPAMALLALYPLLAVLLPGLANYEVLPNGHAAHYSAVRSTAAYIFLKNHNQKY